MLGWVKSGKMSRWFGVRMNFIGLISWMMVIHFIIHYVFSIYTIVTIYYSILIDRPHFGVRYTTLNQPATI